MKNRTRASRELSRDEFARAHALDRLAKVDAPEPEVVRFVEQLAGALSWICGKPHVLDHFDLWVRAETSDVAAQLKQRLARCSAAERAAAHWIARELPELTTERACIVADVLALDLCLVDYIKIVDGTPARPRMRFVAPALLSALKDQLYTGGGFLTALRDGREVPVLHVVEGAAK